MNGAMRHFIKSVGKRHLGAIGVRVAGISHAVSPAMAE